MLWLFIPHVLAFCWVCVSVPCCWVRAVWWGGFSQGLLWGSKTLERCRQMWFQALAIGVPVSRGATFYPQLTVNSYMLRNESHFQAASFFLAKALTAKEFSADPNLQLPTARSGRAAASSWREQLSVFLSKDISPSQPVKLNILIGAFLKGSQSRSGGKCANSKGNGPWHSGKYRWWECLYHSRPVSLCQKMGRLWFWSFPNVLDFILGKYIQSWWMESGKE